MIKTDQIVSLIRSHMNSDDAQFRKIALQISASEARAGHTTAAASIHEAATCPAKIQTFKLKAINAAVADLLLMAENNCRNSGPRAQPAFHYSKDGESSDKIYGRDWIEVGEDF